MISAPGGPRRDDAQTVLDERGNVRLRSRHHFEVVGLVLLGDADLHQPENYKDKETADKLVEIGPDVTQSPIKGIDPSEQSRKP